nr:reverse transcriptase domain-containing protein [Tanacetum cinerariifolium]
MLQEPIKGYEDAIVVPQINKNNFELKQTLINLVPSNQFTGRQDPQNHLRFFNKVTSTFRHPEVPKTMIKLLLFPFSLEGEARIWLDKEPPRSILTWEDLVSKFINHFFPPAKTTYLRNEITNFLQKPNQTFNEAWECFKICSGNVLTMQIATSLEDKLDIRMNRFEKSLNDMKNSFITPTAPIKAVEENNLKTYGVAENVVVKIGKFYFPADFVVLYFIADLPVSLILGRPFSSTTHAIINGHEREIILRQDQQSLTIQCGDISSIKKFEQIKKIDFIDSEGRDFDSEEIKNFLNDDLSPFGVEDSLFNMEEDILFLESLLREQPSPNHLIIPNQTKSPIEEPKHSFNMGYEHFNTNLVTNDVAESSTKNLVPIPRECKVALENGSKSIEPFKDDFSVFTTFSSPLFDIDKINSDKLNSHVESNSDESTSNHDTVMFDNRDEFSGPLIPIHIVEEERIRREHADYINQMEMLFTINPRPHPSTHDNTNIESFSSFPIPIQIQENDSHRKRLMLLP